MSDKTYQMSKEYWKLTDNQPFRDTSNSKFWALVNWAAAIERRLLNLETLESGTTSPSETSSSVVTGTAEDGKITSLDLSTWSFHANPDGHLPLSVQQAISASCNSLRLHGNVQAEVILSIRFSKDLTPPTGAESPTPRASGHAGELPPYKQGKSLSPSSSSLVSDAASTGGKSEAVGNG